MEVPVVSVPAVVNPHSTSIDIPDISPINDNKQSIATIHLGQAVIELYNNTSSETLKTLFEVIAHA